MLTNAGYIVHILEKPYLLPYPYFRNFIAPFQFFYKILYFIIKTKGTYSKAKIFHLSAFYCNLIFFEFLFIRISKILKYKTIYEIRAGGMINAYDQRSNLYRKLFMATLKSSDTILCQGQEYCDFLANSFKLHAIYYPNYIENKYIKADIEYENRLTTDTMQIIYFGRIAESKNVGIIIQIAQILQESNQKFHINIFGKGSKEYINQLRSICEKHNLTEKITFNQELSFDGISKVLNEQHFFIFPTNESREGHSNSLTEAMNFGIVPIASNIGFNNAVINNNDLIINELNPTKYAARMTEIFNNRELWKKYSIAVHQRIVENFTERKISNLLLSAYRNLENDIC